MRFDSTTELPADTECMGQYVVVIAGGQWFGLPIGRVRVVFVPELVTRVPLAEPEVAGVLNLRGRIITAIDLRRRLGLPPRPEGVSAIAVGIEWRGESYGLLADAVGDVIKLAQSERDPNPVHLEPEFARVCAGVYRLDGQLLIVLDIDRVLGSAAEPIAA